MKVKITVTIFIILGIITGLVVLTRNGIEKKSMVLDKVIIAGTGGSSGMPIFLAQEKGFFKDEGLDAEIKEFEAGRFAGDNLIAGNSNFATMTDFAFVSLLANNKNDSNLKVVARMATVKNHELLARKDANISKPEDLAGKKIGVTKGTTGHFFLGLFLVRHGLKLADMNVVFLTPSELVEAIINGTIDAIFTWEPNVYKIKKAIGDNIISWPGQDSQLINFLLVSRQDWLDNNGELTEKFLRTLLKTEEYIASNQADAKLFMSRQGGYDSEYIELLWSRHNFSLDLPQDLISLFESQNKWNIKNNIGDDSTPNYLKHIYVEGLLKVKPNSVKIIR